MVDFFAHLFDTGDFPARWRCGNWTAEHGWLHILSDLGIWSAYVAIPCVLGYFVLYSKSNPFRKILLLFGAFILVCGTTHLMEAIIFWWPAYRLAGLIKLITAMVSWATVLALIPVVPRVLAMRSPDELEWEIAMRREVEKDLQRANTELSSAIQVRDYFLASMSHELRTPLNAILGFTGTMLMRLPGPLTATQENQLQIVERSAKHLLSLINDLLDVAKINSGKMELQLEAVQVQSVVNEVLRTLRPLAEAKGLQLESNLPEQKLVIRAERRALLQILLNLTNNAIKFTERGQVLLEVSQRHEPQRVTMLSVSDTGPGIRAEDQERVFEAFEQVGGATRKQEGTGLGLHLSQKLAELLGGEIRLQSEWGKGSTFTLVLREA